MSEVLVLALSNEDLAGLRALAHLLIRAAGGPPADTRGSDESGTGPGRGKSGLSWALLLKYSRDEDFYVGWSITGQEPVWCGTRAEAAAAGFLDESMDRADHSGTSSLPTIDHERMAPEEGRPFCHWDAAGMAMHWRGFLPRRFLRAFALLYLTGEKQAAFDLLEPREGAAGQVRRG